MPVVKHLRGDTQEIKGKVHGNDVINKGEFIFLGRGNAIVGGTGDSYVYPVYPKLNGTSPAYFEQNFLGVSMKGSISGTTEDIPIATAGIFRAQVKLGTSATSMFSKVGLTVAASTIFTGGVSISNTTVSIGHGGDHDSCRVGRAVKHEPSATHVDFMLMTLLSGSSMITLV